MNPPYAQFTRDLTISFLILIAISVAACMFTLGAAWGVCIDIGGNHSGVVSAAMNTAGQVGGFLCPIVVTYVVERYHAWSAPIYLMAGLFAIGTVAWLLIDPKERVFPAAVHSSGVPSVSEG